MKPYKKRAKNGWCGGKGYKDQSNRSERVFEKKEIRQELKMLEEGEDFRYQNKSKKTPTSEEKLIKQIAWYERVLEEWKRPNRESQSRNFCGDNWYNGIVSSYTSTIKKLKEKLNESNKG